MSRFFDIGIEHHLGKEDHLSTIDALLDWSAFLVILEDVHALLGREGYCPLKMFKCLLLQAWHSLSDPSLEQRLRVRLDVLRFTGLGIKDARPDETTFCCFRNKLATQGKYETLLDEVNRQLETHGMKVKEAQAAIVDATLIASNARPRKVTEIAEEGSVDTAYSADPEATWKTKGNRHHFGYQAFARCDEEGFIDKAHVTPANLPETKELETMAEGLAPGTRVNADKGFFSAANKTALKERGLKNRLMFKALRNTPLTAHMKRFNRLISRTRWRVEQCFGCTTKTVANAHRVLAQFGACLPLAYPYSAYR